MQEDFEHFNWEDLFKDQSTKDSLNNIQSNFSTLVTTPTECIRGKLQMHRGHSKPVDCRPVAWQSPQSPNGRLISHQDSTSSLPEFLEHEFFVDDMIDTDFKLPELETEKLKDDDLFAEMDNIFENKDFNIETDCEKMEEVVHFYNEFFFDVNSNDVETQDHSTNKKNENFVLNTLDVKIGNNNNNIGVVDGSVVCGQSYVVVLNDGNEALNLNNNIRISNTNNKTHDEMFITTPNNNKIVKIEKQNNISNNIKRNNTVSKKNLKRKCLG